MTPLSGRIRRWFGRSAGVVILLLGVSASLPVTTAKELFPGADGCPTVWAGGWGVADRRGPLVPAVGAVSVTLCELGASLLDGPGPASPPRPGQARKLTTRIAEMVAVLNSLPARDEMEAALRAEMKAQGRSLPDDLHLGEVCNLVGYGNELSFAVHYRDRPPAVVLLNRNCGTAHYAGRTRFLGGSPIDAFLAFYRDQLATGATGVPAPDCPAALLVRQVDIRDVLGRPRDDIARNRGGSATFLPSPLAAVTACRYRADGDRLRLRAHLSLHEDLEPVRALLNVASTVETVVSERGSESLANGTDCGMPSPTWAPVSSLDVMWVTDVTGAVAEARIWRAPCQAVFTGAGGGLTVKPALLDRLDVWLAG